MTIPAPRPAASTGRRRGLRIWHLLIIIPTIAIVASWVGRERRIHRNVVAAQDRLRLLGSIQVTRESGFVVRYGEPGESGSAVTLPAEDFFMLPHGDHTEFGYRFFFSGDETAWEWWAVPVNRWAARGAFHIGPDGVLFGDDVGPHTPVPPVPPDDEEE